MKNLYLRLLIVLAALLIFVPASAQEDFEVPISISEWPLGAAPETVLSIPQLKIAVKQWMEAENAILIIRYPGGDVGNQWAVEVRDRLVSFGVESKHIEIQPGSGIEDTLLIIVYEQRIAS